MWSFPPFLPICNLLGRNRNSGMAAIYLLCPVSCSGRRNTNFPGCNFTKISTYTFCKSFVSWWHFAWLPAVIVPLRKEQCQIISPPAFFLVAQRPETGIRDPQTKRRPGLWMEQLCLSLMLMRSGREEMLNSNPGLPNSLPLPRWWAEPAGSRDGPEVPRGSGCYSAGRKGSKSFAYLNSSFCSGITVAALICKLG